MDRALDFKMNLVALRWILSSLFTFLLVNGHQTTEQYSRFDLTREQYKVFSVDSSWKKMKFMLKFMFGWRGIDRSMKLACSSVCFNYSTGFSNDAFSPFKNSTKEARLLRNGILWLRLTKVGVNMKAIFLLGIMVWMQISRSRFKQWKISLLIPHSYVLGCFVNFLVIFGYIWG